VIPESHRREILRWYFIDAVQPIRRVRDCDATVEDLLSRKGEAFGDWLEEQSQDLGEHHQQEMVDRYWEEFHNYDDSYPETTRRALFVVAFSHLEHALNKLCRIVQDSLQLRARLKDAHGKGIVRAKTYLKRIAGLQFPDGGVEWVRVQELQEVRNCIVHRAGEVGDSDNNLKKWIDAHADIASVSPAGTLALEEGFLPYALDVIEAILREIHAALPDRFASE